MPERGVDRVKTSLVILTLCAASFASSTVGARGGILAGECRGASVSPWQRARCLAGRVEWHHGLPAQEKPRPKDSTELSVAGCLKGRMFTVTGNPNESGALVSGPNVIGRSFRLAGPKEVIAEVKKHNGHLVEVTGLVKTSDLSSSGPGVQVGNSRIVIGAAPMSSDPTRSSPQRDPLYQQVVMDATSVRFLSESCPIEKR